MLHPAGIIVSDVFGVSARRMLAALLEGKSTPEEMARLAKVRMRAKIPELEQALTGVVKEHHRFLLARQLAHVDFLDEQIAPDNAPLRYIKIIHKDSEEPSHHEDMALGDPNNIIC